ncbi:chemotaxis protein CheD [Peptococcaceae bacterium SCADC1_2_3]|nr:chemotaxis protein CheD [Peptococcaceae bacterium SCADC1_2_3]KFI35536.1 chemotaxis protein CheD [Peptococcaceae bacterium SCADC1_2_3]KFI35980.1 chemotaxis protein CheD [Peptococcaceae bacterium SCADC1_2_3]KFI37190.1 chemotaxis protein CheD [Peptococcaceae bacterium SCADC1_2_3]
MTALEIQVGIAEYKIAKMPNRLVTFGLGSCVGMSLYDRVNKLGGLIHIMLPDSTMFKQQSIKQGKFANTGIPLLVSELLNSGGKMAYLEAKLVGGAQMFDGFDTFKIGQRNIEKCSQILHQIGIKVVAQETGGNQGRTMILDTTTGKVYIRVLGSQLKVI